MSNELYSRKIVGDRHACLARTQRQHDSIPFLLPLAQHAQGHFLLAALLSSDVPETLVLSFGPLVQVRVLYFVGRALLKEDRPTFALHLVHGMNPHLFQPVSVIIALDHFGGFLHRQT